MILKETILKTADNSGAFSIKVIHTYTTSINKIGRLVKTVPYRFNSKRHIQKKKKYQIVLINQAFPIKRGNGFTVKWFLNRGVVLTEKGDKILGSRVIGPVDRRIRKFIRSPSSLIMRKIISLSDAII